tara:strand:+ start:1152 stop:1487 length:336 start_codon:yes stop_codon:yes gene_type:complete
MKDYKISIKEEDGKIKVEVEMEPYNHLLRPKMYFKTQHAIKHLKENNYEFGECLQKASLYNRDENNLKGTWIFDKKITKTLDKPAKNVILDKENKVVPKKRKSKVNKKTSN